MKRPVDLIMFDLDGTLADTGQDLAEAVNYTRARFDLAPLPQKAISTHIGRGVEYLIRHAIAEAASSRFHQLLSVFLRRYEDHLLDKTVLYPHALEALAYFGDKRRVVVTNKLQRLAVALLQGLAVADRFDVILGGDSAVAKKPDPALLQTALRQFRIEPAAALMVGDGDIDIEAGQRAGVLTCGVTYGLGSRDALIAAKPDVMIDDLGQLSCHFC